MRPAAISRIVVSALFALTLLAFAGCELTGVDTSEELSAESRKVKPEKTTALTVETVSTVPVYTGETGEYRLLSQEDFMTMFYQQDDPRLITVDIIPDRFTGYPEPIVDYTIPTNPEFSLFETPLYNAYDTSVTKKYETISFTSFDPELYFYFDGADERVFVEAEDLLGTHILTGFHLVGSETKGDKIIGTSVFETLNGQDYTPYSSSFYTAYDSEQETTTLSLFFYYNDDTGEKVFVSEDSSDATHKITGKKPVGFTTLGYQYLGEETIGYEDTGYVITGERIVGWQCSSYGLWAGQTHEAGIVTISNDNENFYLKIDTNDLADISELHVFAYASLSDIPTKRPSPGQAPYKLESINADQSPEIAIPIADLSASIREVESYYFIIHAELIGESEHGDQEGSLGGETAYAAGDETPSFDGKGSWFYTVGYSPTPLLEYLTEDLREDIKVDVIIEVAEQIYEYVIEDLNNNGGGTGDPEVQDYFPTWGQDISHIILVFNQSTGDQDGDGYYTVKFDEWPDEADRDLDHSIEALLDFLYLHDPNIVPGTLPLGSSIKGGIQTTDFYLYGVGDSEPDTPPANLGFKYPGGSSNESPSSAIDSTRDYGEVF